MITTIAELRNNFWEEHKQYKRLPKARDNQNNYHADIRMAWCDFVEHHVRNESISESLANRATL